MIPNFTQFSEALWRGGQPRTQDWQYLRKLGVKTVIKLNSERDGSDQGAVDLGMNLVKFPISLWEEVITEPDLERLVEIVMGIQPYTFIHCTHGQDRTGLLVGVYRVWREHWVVRQAWEEMQKNRFHELLFGLDKAWHDLTRPFFLTSPCKASHSS